MKNIFKIFKRDMKRIVSSWVVLVVVIGLIVLPALYAWFNIKASWDPYGNTKGIKVAIVNEDKGTNFQGKNVNVGEKLVENLQGNDKLGWVFVDAKEAQDGVERGKYYASILIPKDFTQNITSFVNKNIKKPEIIYTVNEKTNAIAPKITDKGVSTIKSEVDTTIVETVDGILLKSLSDIGVGIINLKPTINKVSDMIITLNKDMPDIENIVNSAYDGTAIAKELIPKVQSDIPTVKDTLERTSGVLGASKENLNSFKDGFNNAAPIIKEGLSFTNEVLTSIDNLLKDIKKLDKNSINKALDDISLKVIGIEGKVQDAIGILKPLSVFKPELKNVISQLEDINSKLEDLNKNILDAKSKVENGNGNFNSKLEEIQGNVANLNSIVGGLVNNFDTQVSGTINEGVSEINKIVDNSLVLINDAEKNIPQVQRLLDSLYSGSILGNEELAKLKDDMPFIKEKVSSLAAKLQGLSDEEKLDFVLNAITNGWQEKVSFLGSPVEIKENKLFPIPNYGSGMSPFFSTLSLWVGALILASLLTVDTDDLQEGKEIKPYEKYFGKGLTFVFIGICQSLVVTLGDLFILKTYVKEPVLFVLTGVFISIVFTMIVYTLVSIFGNVGKAIGVILLVLQISGSGGTFPIEVAPKFFQMINPVLPFSYAIPAMREAVGGVVPSILIEDYIVLAIFLGIALIFGLILKGPINRGTRVLVDKLKHSGLIGH